MNVIHHGSNLNKFGCQGHRSGFNTMMADGKAEGATKLRSFYCLYFTWPNNFIETSDTSDYLHL